MRAAIIGCGVISKTHIAALEAAGATVAWICDDQPDRLANIAERVPAARQASALETVLADPDVDVVHICTPHATHVEQLEAVLAAGKHVITEKPLAATPEGVRRMLTAAEAAEARGQFAACIFQHRYSRLAQLIRDVVADGRFGALTSARLPFRCTRRQSYYDKDAWRGTWAIEGGGVCINQAIHSIDMLTWFCGNEPLEVTTDHLANVRLQGVIEVEDEARAQVRFASGVIAEIDCANDQQSGWDMEIQLRSERGYLSYSLNQGGRLLALEHDDAELVAELRACEQAIINGETTAMPGKADYGDLHAVQIADCLTRIAAGDKPFIRIADAAPTTELVLGIYHSAAKAAPAALPLTEYLTPNLAAATAGKD